MKKVPDPAGQKLTVSGSSSLPLLAGGGGYSRGEYIPLPDYSVGIYAPDPEAYSAFRKLFLPVITEYHGLKAELRAPIRFTLDISIPIESEHLDYRVRVLNPSKRCTNKYV